MNRKQSISRSLCKALKDYRLQLKFRLNSTKVFELNVFKQGFKGTSQQENTAHKDFGEIIWPVSTGKIRTIAKGNCSDGGKTRLILQ